jgi:hypothetical protein
MKNIKNIIILTITLVVIDIALLWIFKILNFVAAENFLGLLKDSLSIIGIIFLVGLVISLIFNLGKKQ